MYVPYLTMIVEDLVKLITLVNRKRKGKEIISVDPLIIEEMGKQIEGQ